MIECEECVEFRSAEQEQDGGDESKHGSGDRARDDSGDDTQLPIKFLLKEAQGVNIVNGKPTAHFSSLRRCGSKPVILLTVKRPGISTSGFSHDSGFHIDRYFFEKTQHRHKQAVFQISDRQAEPTKRRGTGSWTTI